MRRARRAGKAINARAKRAERRAKSILVKAGVKRTRVNAMATMAKGKARGAARGLIRVAKKKARAKLASV